MDKYILENGHPVICHDLLKWAKWMEDNFGESFQSMYQPHSDQRVSGTFLGIDHNFTKEGEPILYEVRVDGGDNDGYTMRSSTRRQAESDYDDVCDMVFGASELEPDIETDIDIGEHGRNVEFGGVGV